MADETIFEKIMRGDIPAEIVYRDDHVTAFRDIQPQAPTHVLIVPNKPIPSVSDLAPEDEPAMGRLMLAAAEIARREGIAESGYRLIVNCGDHGGQEVPHLHLHLVGGRALGPMLSRPR